MGYYLDSGGASELRGRATCSRQRCVRPRLASQAHPPLTESSKTLGPGSQALFLRASVMAGVPSIARSAYPGQEV